VPDQAKNQSWPDDARIAQTIATVLDRKSRIQLIFDFLITVIACNTLKVLVMLWVLYTDRSKYLVTLGDAAASFPQRPDPHTIEDCMLDKEAHLYKLGLQAELEPPSSACATMHDRLSGIWQPKWLRYSVSLLEHRQNFFVIL
jgi:hypothetical protein